MCRLFPNIQIQSSFGTTGYNDWKHVADRISELENRSEHRKSMISYCMRHKGIGLIDTDLVLQFNEERNYWRQVLERVVADIKFLSARGMPFRGDDEIIGSVHNRNYMGTLELLSQFDPFLKEHAKICQVGQGQYIIFISKHL